MAQHTNEVKQIDALHTSYTELKKEIQKIIVGQEEVINNVLLTIFSGGHSLLVGVPGLAKTLLVTTIAKALGIQYNRIQFTPDLMPSDIIGTEILNSDRKFEFNKGPLFTNFLLADEINRTPPKTQSALLEAMQEHAITTGGTRYKLTEPFFVLATQNPIEQEGTYPLPEAQLDRFMTNIWLDYPSLEDEITIVKSTTSGIKIPISKQLTSQEIIDYQKIIQKIPVPDKVIEYAATLVAKTRGSSPYATDFTKKYISWGAGPRASQYLIIGAKTHAALNGKYSPDIEDIQAIAHTILRHRIVKNYKADAEGLSVDTIISNLMTS
ncbi:MAG: MoxR family ATPase [Bacteroidales bacterium]